MVDHENGVPFLAVSVARERTEDVRKELWALGLTDDTRKIIEKGDTNEIPVKDLPKTIAENYELIVQEGPIFREGTKDPYDRIVARIEIDRDLKSYLPRKWEFIGKVLLIKVPEALVPFKDVVAQAYGAELGVNAVLNDLGVEGELRQPKFEHLWGDKETETIHTENNVRFAIDPLKVMFSSGNIDERIRMSTIPKEGEVVLDMFAGIGYFVIPMAVHSPAAKFIACEKNEVAYRYLVKNIDLNHVKYKFEAILGDNMDAPERVADRIVMGYLPSPSEYLPKAIKILKRNKKCVIHYHENASEAEIPGALFSRVAGAAGGPGRGAKLMGYKWIKSYAPNIWHAVVDVEIS